MTKEPSCLLAVSKRKAGLPLKTQGNKSQHTFDTISSPHSHSFLRTQTIQSHQERKLRFSPKFPSVNLKLLGGFPDHGLIKTDRSLTPSQQGSPWIHFVVKFSF